MTSVGALRRLILVAATAALCACHGGGGGGGASGPIAIRDVQSPTGGRRAALAECLGFTLAANEPGVTFAEDVVVSLGPLEVPVQRVNASELRAGAEANDHRCFWLPPFGEPGAWDLTVSSAAGTWTVPKAFRIDAPEITDVGLVAKDRVWAEGRFEQPWDADVYRATFTDAYHVYDHIDFFARGGAEILPELQFWEEEYPDAYVARGGHTVIFPQSGTHYVIARDTRGLADGGSDYALGFVGDELGSTDGADERCDGAPEIRARGYHVDYDDLDDHFDPRGADGCADTIYGSSIDAPGADAVWTVRVPAGNELRVATYDDHIDNVVYLLEADACEPRPTRCVAAAGRFGGGNTDVLIHRNDTEEEQTFFLVHDSATVPDEEVGSFLINVQLF